MFGAQHNNKKRSTDNMSNNDIGRSLHNLMRPMFGLNSVVLPTKGKKQCRGCGNRGNNLNN